MTIVEHERDGYLLSTDKTRLDVDLIHTWLSEVSYWAQGRPRDVTERAVEHSLCIGVYKDGEQVGLARVVTDYATFAWLCDVFIVEAHRGRGLGKWLIAAGVAAHPDLQGILLFLATRDAHELYRRYGGFEAMAHPERWMVRPRTGGSSASQG